MNFTALEMVSPRLILKSYDDADAADIFSAVTATLCRFLTFDPEPDLASFAAIGRSWRPEMEAARQAVFVVRRARNGEFLGLVGLHDISLGAPETGIWIKEAAQSLGFGREALGRIVAWAGDALGFDYVYHTAAVENLASRRLAERLGGQEIARPTLRKRSGIELPSIRYRLPTA